MPLEVSLVGRGLVTFGKAAEVAQHSRPNHVWQQVPFQAHVWSGQSCLQASARHLNQNQQACPKGPNYRLAKDMPLPSLKLPHALPSRAMLGGEGRMRTPTSCATWSLAVRKARQKSSDHQTGTAHDAGDCRGGEALCL